MIITTLAVLEIICQSANLRGWQLKWKKTKKKTVSFLSAPVKKEP